MALISLLYQTGILRCINIFIYSRMETAIGTAIDKIYNGIAVNVNCLQTRNVISVKTVNAAAAMFTAA